MTTDTSRHRLGLIAVLAVSLFGALFARLWTLQVVEGQELDTLAQSQSTRTVITPAPRGRILDRNGVVLVRNRPSVVLGVDLQKFAALDEDEQADLLKRLATALNRGKPADDQVTTKSIQRTLNSDRYSRYRPIPIADDLTIEQEIYFREQADQFPATVVEQTTVRDYPHGSLAAHVLGYVGAVSDDRWKKIEEDGNDGPKPYTRSDEIGIAGVEATYESALRGAPGKRVYEVDRQNRVVQELVDQRIDPLPGDDLYLSIDARIQAATEISLRSQIEQRRATPGQVTAYFPAETGAAAIVDPANGQVRAMASYPTYNPADLVGGISQELWDFLGDEENFYPLNNRAIAGTYAPASTFKLATAHAGLELGVINPSDYVPDPGFYVPPGCPPTNDSCRFSSPTAESGGGAPVDLKAALTVSSDVYFYRIGNDSWALHADGDRAPETAFQDAARELGYGEKTGIDLPGEVRGRVPDPAWLDEFDKTINGTSTEAGDWRAGTSINMSIGQGDVLATPLQMANAYAAFANGGTLHQPSVLDRVVPAGAQEPTTSHEPKVLGTVDWTSQEAYQSMMAGFEGVVAPNVGGTARAAFEGFPLSSWQAAGKTGTAQSGPRGDRDDDNSLFVGFGPLPNPEYVAAAVVEHAGGGGAAAAPVVRRVFEAIALDTLDAVDLDAVADPASFASDAYTSADVGSGTDAAAASRAGLPTCADGEDGGEDVPDGELSDNDDACSADDDQGSGADGTTGTTGTDGTSGTGGAPTGSSGSPGTSGSGRDPSGDGSDGGPDE